jgi:GMP synthase (glutamine-hydrolysing)
MAHELGGEVVRPRSASTAPATITITDGDALFDGIDREQPVWMSHGDAILRLPGGFSGHRPDRREPLRRPRGPWPEPLRHPVPSRGRPHARSGARCLRNFVVGIAGVRPSWTPANLIETTVAEIRDRVGSGSVICALSGGVDSPSPRRSSIGRSATS